MQLNGNGNGNGHHPRHALNATVPVQQPYDETAERAVLGAILLNRDVMIAVAPLLSADDFFIASHQAIYDAIQTLYERRVPPDEVTVAALLRDRNQLEQIGGMPTLIHLSAVGVASYHAEHYARMVRTLADRRRLIAAGSRIVALGYVEADADAAQAQAQAILNEVVRAPHTPDLGEVFGDLLTFYRLDEPRGVQTGVAELDDLTGGLMPGDLTIIAGRPGHGKTSFALTLAERVARAGRAVLYVSLEMTRHELAQRLLARRSGVPVRAQRRAALTDVQIAALVRAMAECADLPLIINDERRLTVEDVRLHALATARARDGLALVIVDYIQLLTVHVERGANYAQALGEASHALKILARDLDAPVIAVAQLNRDLDHRTDKIPQLSDLRDSGRLEADADQVIFVVRPELYEPNNERLRGVIRLHLAKNRHDRTGVVDARFDGASTMVQG